MARSRNIKPGFYKNDSLAECSLAARFMFPGLWMLADREGRLENRPKRIKGELFPFDNITVNELLEELKKWGFIELYSYDGNDYIQINNFNRHQTPHSTEKDSYIPDKDGYLTKYKRDKQNRIIPESKELIKLKQEHTKQQLNNCYETVKQLSDNTLIPDSRFLIPDSPIPDSPIPDSPIPDSPIPDSPIPDNSSCEELTAPPKGDARKKTREPTEIDLLKHHGVDGQIAKDFLKIRKSKRLPLTKTALEEISIEAGRAGLTTLEAVTISARRGWAGFSANWDWRRDQKINTSQAPPMSKFVMPKVDYGEYEPSDDKFNAMKIIEGERLT